MEQQVHDAYMEVLGRRADPDGLKTYTERLRKGKSVQWLKRVLQRSGEKKKTGVPHIGTRVTAKFRSEMKINVIILEDTLRTHTLKCIDNVKLYCSGVLNKIIVASELNHSIPNVDTVVVRSLANIESWYSKFKEGDNLIVYSSIRLNAVVTIDTLTALHEGSILYPDTLYSLSQGYAKYTRYEPFTITTNPAALFVFKHQHTTLTSFQKIHEVRTMTFPYIQIIEESTSFYRICRKQKCATNYTFEKDRVVLVLDASTPTPDQDSGSNGIFNMMRAFKEASCDVVFCGWDNTTYFPYYTDKLGALGIYSHFRDDCDTLRPSQVDLHQICERACLIVMCRLNSVETCLPYFNEFSNKVLFHTLDLHFVRLNREATLQHRIIDSQIESKELMYIKKAKFASVINTYEKSMLSQKHIEQNIVLIPINIEIPKKIMYKANKREGIIFVGGFSHTPNVDALEFLISTDVPLPVHIVGSKLPTALQRKLPKNYQYHGFLPETDLRSLMHRVRLNIVPLRYGAGSKGKIAHALANCLPTLSTPIGVEGMSIPDDSIFVSREESFQKHILVTYENFDLCDSVANKGYEFAKQHFSYENQKKVIERDVLPYC